MEIIIDGNPERKQRPRFARIGNHVRTYTSKATSDYEDKIKKAYEKQSNGENFEDESIKVSINAYFEAPKSWSEKKKKKAIDGEILPANAIDVDNIAKVALDALNGLAYKDDHYITSLMIRKRYSDSPRLEVVILSDTD